MSFVELGLEAAVILGFACFLRSTYVGSYARVCEVQLFRGLFPRCLPVVANKVLHLLIHQPVLEDLQPPLATESVRAPLPPVS